MKTTDTLAAAMVCLLFAMVSIASAGDSAKSAKSQAASSLPPTQTTLVNRQLKSTTLETGVLGVTIQGLSPIDTPLNFTCPAASCTITAEVQVQFGLASSSDNESALCAILDGVEIEPFCPDTGEVPSDQNYLLASYTFVQGSLAKGKHTIQSAVRAAKTVTLGAYTVTYRLYEP